MKGVKQISTRGMTRAAWLEERRKSIGGSDAAGIIGLSKWSSPYMVWADKTGRLPDKPDTEAMRIGRDLEDYVARRWMEETGKRCKRLPAILRNPAYPFAHADIDRLVIGESAGLECKTTSDLDLRQYSGGEFPEKYYVQCVHYLAVTGLRRWYLAVLVFGRGFFTYTLERDEAEIAALMAAERDFWADVESDTPPEIDGSYATSDTLQAIYADSRPEECELFGREDILRVYQTLKGQRDEIDERMNQIQNTLKADLGDAERGLCAGYTVTWRSQRRRTFQPALLREEHPEIDLERYYKTTTCRSMKITAAKK